jgi:hypothetical protein
MLSINQMKQFIIDYETDWLMDCNDGNVIGDILKHGWKGWDNMSDEAIILKFKDLTED